MINAIGLITLLVAIVICVPIAFLSDYFHLPFCGGRWRPSSSTNWRTTDTCDKCGKTRTASLDQ
jgi:hypothetical protein